MEEVPLWCVVCGQDARHELCPCEDPARSFPMTAEERERLLRILNETEIPNLSS